MRSHENELQWLEDDTACKVIKVALSRLWFKPLVGANPARSSKAAVHTRTAGRRRGTGSFGDATPNPDDTISILKHVEPKSSP